MPVFPDVFDGRCLYALVFRDGRWTKLCTTYARHMITTFGIKCCDPPAPPHFNIDLCLPRRGVRHPRWCIILSMGTLSGEVLLLTMLRCGGPGEGDDIDFALQGCPPKVVHNFVHLLHQKRGNLYGLRVFPAHVSLRNQSGIDGPGVLVWWHRHQTNTPGPSIPL